MSEGTGGVDRLGWGGALALAAATLLLGVVNPLPLVLLPFAMLVLSLPPFRPANLALGAAIALLGVLLAAGPLGLVALVWPVLLGVLLVALTRARSDWSPFARFLSATALAAVTAAAGLLVSGHAAAFDAQMLEYFRQLATLMLEQLRERAADAPWLEQMEQAAPQFTQAQWMVYPAIIGLQSLAALALGWWWFTRLPGRAGHWAPLARLRAFRFADHLIWVLIAGLILIALPLQGAPDRLGLNALLFMGALYALRGLAVLAFWVAGVPTAFAVLLGVFAVVFRLVPFFLTVALVVGVGDTWLDVRGRAAEATRT